MQVAEKQIRAIVEEVVRDLIGNKSAMGPAQGVFDSIDEAVTEAHSAACASRSVTLQTRRRIISGMRAIVEQNADALSRMAVEETGMGRIDDKLQKNLLAAQKTPGVEDIETATQTDEYGMTVTERAPYGLIGAITPSTNPTESIICNAIGMIAGGNAVVFNPHPAARTVSAFTVALINHAVQEAEGPRNLVTTVSAPTIDSGTRMMHDSRVALLVVTGGPAVVRAALETDKKVIAAGPGNPPTVVDETADIARAGRDIVMGGSFDNNIVCIDEKEILAVAVIADALKESMRAAHAYELTREQADRLTALLIADPGRPGHEGAANKQYVGKNARVLARLIGLEVPEATRMLFAEVGQDHPLVWTEQLTPMLPLVRFNSAEEAIEFAAECEHGMRHTASIHSANVERITRMGRLMNCSLFVANGSNFNGMAAGGAGFTSYTIASPTGEGFTRPRTFTRERRMSVIGGLRIV
ncbi:MAG: aldehyde dehydrogenase EutE [Spirochaetaceae bacterium]|nr:MAG: aldehyde dehydrogenase EutE [Spirochaetaceae bacterium]